MAANQIDALVIFGATSDLAKLETFPTLAGLVERGVLPDQDTWRDPAG